jgi:hypothetical protein
LAGNFDFGSLTMDDLSGLLGAAANMGLGKHDPDDQKYMPQPRRFIYGLYDAAAQMFAHSVPASPMTSANLCRAISYIGADDNTANGLLLVLGAEAYSDIARSNRPDSKCYLTGMHMLWQAGDWLDKKHNLQFPPSVDWWELMRVRNALIRKPQHTSHNQKDMHETLVSASKDEAGILEVTKCDYTPRTLPFSVDVLVRTRHYNVILEFDGDGHFVGPYSSLNGTTLWRNFMMRAYGFTVISISEDEWAAAADRQKFLLAKLANYLYASSSPSPAAAAAAAANHSRSSTAAAAPAAFNSLLFAPHQCC